MSFAEHQNNNHSDENESNFGLPDLEYKPLDQSKQPSQYEYEPIQQNEYAPHLEQEDGGYPNDDLDEDQTSTRQPNLMEEEPPRSKAPIIITTLILLVLSAGGFLYWKYVMVPQKEKEKLEKLEREKKEKAQKEEAARLAKLQEEEAARLAKLQEEEAAKAAATPVIGTIEKLSGPIGKYHIVAASSVDVDLIMDFAKKLKTKGISSKIILPFGKYKFNRLSVGSFDSIDSAQSAIESLKAEYGNEIWILRY